MQLKPALFASEAFCASGEVAHETEPETHPQTQPEALEQTDRPWRRQLQLAGFDRPKIILNDEVYLTRTGGHNPRADEMAIELIDHFASLSGKWIETERSGPTGIGATAEKAAGIAENNSRMPDYQGLVELKTSRTHHADKNGFLTLFTLSPDFGEGFVSGTRELLATFGYIAKGVRRLNLSLSAAERNSRGHWLEIDTTEGWLRAMHATQPDTLRWHLDSLLLAVSKKLRCTVFLIADSRKGEEQKESYRFQHAVHARLRGAVAFVELLQEGLIRMEFNMRDGKPNEKSDHKNRGFSFRIRRRDLPRLFEIVGVYELSSGQKRRTDGSGIF